MNPEALKQEQVILEDPTAGIFGHINSGSAGMANQTSARAIRHWKATTLYHKTKDILYVKEFLGHRKIDSTLIYINIERALFHDDASGEFHVKVAQTPEEIKGLLEAGFEHVCEKDNMLFFRKRK